MMIISQVNELTDEEKENIRQLFTLMLLSVTMKEDKLTNVHPIDFASYVVFLHNVLLTKHCLAWNAQRRPAAAAIARLYFFILDA